jgi:hypothetical protein
MELNLINLRGKERPTKGPVLLVHGAGVRANIFRVPTDHTFVDALVEQGFDVWLENWRASIDLPSNEWTLDQAAAYDHPAAVETVVAETGENNIQAVIHCQGSTSFMMSAAAGLVPQVTTIVSNAVALHPVVPWFSRVKLRYAAPAISNLMTYLDPGAGDSPETNWARILTALVKLGHHECRSTVCKLVSFTYGSGHPALWLHKNLNNETHDAFLGREFGSVPLSFFLQMAECVEAGELVSTGRVAGLPETFTAEAPKTDARIVLICGRDNECFLPQSQVATFEWLMEIDRSGRQQIRIFEGYSHLDIFMGRRASRDVFPFIIGELTGRSDVVA